LLALIVIFGALFAFIGALLFKRGLWPRRIGQTPHCPQCDYILSGDQSRCPECGTIADPKTVVRGERHRRDRLLFIGGALALPGIAVLLMAGFDALYHVNWNRLTPLSWLLRDAGSGHAPAWAEIQRRIDNHLLSDADQNTVTEKGLELQGAPATVDVIPGFVDFLGNRFLQRKLTPNQADRFFESMLKVALSVRPVAGSQGGLSFSVSESGRRPSGWECWDHGLKYQVDDGPIEQLNSNGVSVWSDYGTSSTGCTLPRVPAKGKHRLRVRLDVGFAKGSRVDWADDSTFLRRIARDLSTDFEVGK